MKMYARKFLKTWYFYLCIKDFFSLAGNLTTDSYCNNPTTGNKRCCSGHRKVAGRCEPCIGSFGENCSNPCSFGYFGNACHEKCNCSSDTHWCDNISGCKIKDDVDVDSRTQGNKRKHFAFGVVGSMIATSAFWFLIYLVCSWKRGSNRKTQVTMQEEGHSGNSLGESQQQPERNTPPLESGRHIRSKSLQHGAKKRKPVTRSRSHSQDTYGRLNKRSDDYDHLDFLGHQIQPSVSAFSSNYNKIKLKPSQRHGSTDSETFPSYQEQLI